MDDEQPMSPVSRRGRSGRAGPCNACAGSYAAVWAMTGLAAAASSRSARRGGSAGIPGLQLDCTAAAHRSRTSRCSRCTTCRSPRGLCCSRSPGRGGAPAGVASGTRSCSRARLANTVPVGAALGAYGGVLVAYVPQLPLEWAAVALGVAAWVTERDGPLGARGRLLWFAAVAWCVLAAAVLETMAVPSG